MLYHYTTSSKDNINEVILEKFDLIEAKKFLSDLGMEVEMTDGRRLSPNRSALEADMMDFMTGLENLDLMQELKPKFTAYTGMKWFSLCKTVLSSGLT